MLEYAAGLRAGDPVSLRASDDFNPASGQDNLPSDAMPDSSGQEDPRSWDPHKMPIVATTATDVRLTFHADGQVSSSHPAARYSVWTPLVEAYGEVVVIGRSARGDSPDRNLVAGPGVSAHAVPDYSSPFSLLRNLPTIVLRVRQAAQNSDVIFGRLPEPLSIILCATALVMRKPYIVNLVADLETLIKDQPLHVRLGGRVALPVVRALTRRATGAIYVAEHLRRKYPPRAATPILIRSNVQLTSDDISEPRTAATARELALVHVGTQQTTSKGQDTLIAAIAKLKASGLAARATLVGSGRYQEILRAQARQLGVETSIHFAGHISSRADLFEILDSHDIFVLPSRSEGLPRAMIEAMARGLPVIASNVGGIPDILPTVLLDTDPATLADAISELSRSSARMQSASHASIESATRQVASADPVRLTTFFRNIWLSNTRETT